MRPRTRKKIVRLNRLDNNYGHKAVKNDSINELFLMTMLKVAAVGNIAFDIAIVHDIDVPAHVEPQACNVLANFIDTAMNELSFQHDGLLNIYAESRKRILFTVSNTYRDLTEMILPYRTQEIYTGVFGNLRKMKVLTPGIEVSNYINAYKFNEKEVLVQQLFIDK